MSASAENHNHKRSRVDFGVEAEGVLTPLQIKSTDQAVEDNPVFNTEMNQRYLLTVEYIGTAFLGWQKQRGGRTVQGQLEDAVQKFVGSRVQVFGSSRTDTGVHALGNTCHVDIQRRNKRKPNQQMPSFEPLVVKSALNHFLQSGDVAICDVQCIPSNFHARFQATQRTYHYRVICGADHPSIFERERAWHVKGPLHLASMRAACRVLEGHHDFTSFRGAGCQANSPLRTLSELHVMEAPFWPSFPSYHQRRHTPAGNGGGETGGRAGHDSAQGDVEGGDGLTGGSVQEGRGVEMKEVGKEGGGGTQGVGGREGGMGERRGVGCGGQRARGEEGKLEEGGGWGVVGYVITARAPSFLYHQVRLLVGLLKSVGCGTHTPEDAKRILEAKNITLMPAMAPAHGLYLAKVHYDLDGIQNHSPRAEEESELE